MTIASRTQHLEDLDNNLLQGGVMLSEWCVFIVQDIDTVFEAGADIAVIVLAASAIEAHIRYEMECHGKKNLVALIDDFELDERLRSELQILRKYRNKWVHISYPENDRVPLDAPEAVRAENKAMAYLAVRVVREIMYSNPWI